MPRPSVFRARMLAVVVAGGVVGVALRELLLIPFSGETTAGALALPIATMAVNVVGSFALGIVVAVLGDHRPLSRAFLGTGVLGGFTTYSAFAVQTAMLLGTSPLAGMALALVSVLVGLGAAALGIGIAQRPGAAAGADGAEVAE